MLAVSKMDGLSIKEQKKINFSFNSCNLLRIKKSVLIVFSEKNMNVSLRFLMNFIKCLRADVQQM